MNSRRRTADSDNGRMPADQRLKQIVDAVAASEPATVAEVARQVELTRVSVGRFLRQAEKMGLVIRSKGAPSGTSGRQPDLWQLA